MLPFELIRHKVEDHIKVFIFLSIFFSIFRSTRILKEFYLFSILFNLVIIYLGFKLFLKSEYHKKIFLYWSIFITYALLTSLWSYDPIYSFFKALFFGFIALSSIIIGYFFSYHKVDLTNTFTFLNLLFITLSFLSLILGIPADAWTANHGKGFMAFMAHQNTFAALLLFTLIGPFGKVQRAIVNNKAQHYKLIKNFQFLFYSFIILGNLVFIILSHSRASVLSALVFLFLAIFFLLSKRNKSIFSLAILFILILALSSPSVSATVDSYFKKGFDNYFATRVILWGPSLDAAKIGGLWGVGFGVSSPSVITPYTKRNAIGKLVREKGNSILALLEEIGLIGLILFLFIIFYYFKYSLKLLKQNKLLSVNNIYELKYLMIFVVILLAHSQIEGWWVWLGSIYLQIFIVLLSYVPMDKSKKKYV